MQLAYIAGCVFAPVRGVDECLLAKNSDAQSTWENSESLCERCLSRIVKHVLSVCPNGFFGGRENKTRPPCTHSPADILDVLVSWASVGKKKKIRLSIRHNACLLRQHPVTGGTNIATTSPRRVISSFVMIFVRAFHTQAVYLETRLYFKTTLSVCKKTEKKIFYVRHKRDAIFKFIHIADYDALGQESLLISLIWLKMK